MTNPRGAGQGAALAAARKPWSVPRFPEVLFRILADGYGMRAITSVPFSSAPSQVSAPEYEAVSEL